MAVAAEILKFLLGAAWPPESQAIDLGRSTEAKVNTGGGLRDIAIHRIKLSDDLAAAIGSLAFAPNFEKSHLLKGVSLMVI